MEDAEKPVSREFTRTNELLDNYIREFKEDVELTVHNLREKSLMSSSLRAKWLNYYFVEKANKAKIQKAKQTILLQHANKSGIQDSVIRLKSEENVAKNDPKIRQLNELAEKNKAVIEYLEYVMNVMNDFGYSIKNAIEVMKLERM